MRAKRAERPFRNAQPEVLQQQRPDDPVWNTANSRRKAKRQFITFTLVIKAQEMIVTSQPNWMTDVGHFEFRSPQEPPRRIPVGETGDRSHFASMADVEAASSPQDYARDVVIELLRSRDKPTMEKSNWLPLF